MGSTLRRDTDGLGPLVVSIRAFEPVTHLTEAVHLEPFIEFPGIAKKPLQHDITVVEKRIGAERFWALWYGDRAACNNTCSYELSNGDRNVSAYISIPMLQREVRRD